MPIQNVCISQLLCYSSGSWKRLGVSAGAHFEIFFVKVGSTCDCENTTDINEKQNFRRKVVRGPQKYFYSQNTPVRQ